MNQLHSARTLMARAMVVIALLPAPLLLKPSSPGIKLANVTGRVTYSGRPIQNIVICFDLGSDHSAFCMLRPDGSFELANFMAGSGTIPGKYRVHFFCLSSKFPLPDKYSNSRTSDLEVELVSGWNDVSFDLH
jgi:hypothetical protein